jgi:hypothetical protein
LRQATNTSGYRGSHETPWIINRFAHVAREPEILDVCLLRFIEQYLYVAEYRDIGIFSQNFGRKRAATTRNPMSCKQKLSITHMMFSNLRKAEFLTMKGKASRWKRNEDGKGNFKPGLSYGRRGLIHRGTDVYLPEPLAFPRTICSKVYVLVTSIGLEQ